LRYDYLGFSHDYADFFVFLDILIGEGAFKFGLTVNDWGRLLRVCKPIYGNYIFVELNSYTGGLDN